MPQFMITTRKISDDKKTGRTRYLVFDEAQGQEQELTKNAWVARILGSFPPSGPPGPDGVQPRAGDILFLVHGFNVSHDAAKAFHAKCAQALHDTGWSGLLLSYDWPSDGLVFAYLDDRVHAREAAGTLVQSGISLLQSLQRQNCTINLHVMAHSMGCFVTQQAFIWSYQDVPPDWRVGQILLVAADVDYTVFSASNFTAAQFAGHGGRLTAYCNRYDKALLVSNAKRLELAPRMGRVGLPDDTPVMMCEVDCSNYFDKTFPEVGEELSPVTTHCFYFDQKQFWRDAVLTLAGGIDRAMFPTREPAGTGVPNRFSLKLGTEPDDRFRRALTIAKPPTG